MFKIVVRMASSLVGVIILGYIAQASFSDIFAQNSSILSVLFNTLGGMYALVTAFVLVEVWSQYNSLESALTSEAKVLTSLWNYTDYLNDKKISLSMKHALISYIDNTVKNEIPIMGNNKKLSHPSNELIAIMRVIDQIKFNDHRDASAFKSIIQSFENLSSQRMSRISQGSARMPQLLKLFFEMVSFAYLGSYLMQTYTNIYLYLISLSVVGGIVLFVRFIIYDLDNPFDGVWNISTGAYLDSKDYISNSGHAK